jgi:hypothetical protein
MIERHYSHLTPRLRTAILTGKWYELCRVEDQERTDIFCCKNKGQLCGPTLKSLRLRQKLFSTHLDETLTLNVFFI